MARTYRGEHAYGTCDACGVTAKVFGPQINDGDGHCRSCYLEGLLWTEISNPGAGYTVREWHEWATGNDEPLPWFITEEGKYAVMECIDVCQDCGAESKICGKAHWQDTGRCRSCWISWRAKQDELALKWNFSDAIWTEQTWRSWSSYFNEPAP